MRASALRSVLGAGLLLTASLALVAAKSVKDIDRPSFTEGDWKIDPKDDDPGQVQLQLHREWSNGRGDHSNMSSSWDMRREELTGLRREDWNADHAEVSFGLTRDAGTLHFQGVMRHGRGLGEYTFEPNQKFADELGRAGFAPVTPEDMMRLVIHDIDRAWLRGFDGRNMSIDDLVRFKVHGVTPEFVSTMAAGGYRDMSADDVVRLKVHGVDPEFVHDLGRLGYDRPSVDDLVRLKVHGVDADYVRAMLSLAAPKPSVDDMIRLHVHGVEASYVKDLRDAGYDRLAADDLVRLKVHGVTPDLARRARSRDRDVTVDDLIRLKTRGEL